MRSTWRPVSASRWRVMSRAVRIAASSVRIAATSLMIISETRWPKRSKSGSTSGVKTPASRESKKTKPNSRRFMNIGSV